MPADSMIIYISMAICGGFLLLLSCGVIGRRFESEGFKDWMKSRRKMFFCIGAILLIYSGYHLLNL